MTTEDDFQKALDAAPGDWQTRLVFADWLQERGDPRAVGYYALGHLRLCPFIEESLFWWTTLPAECCPEHGVRGNGCSLPADWFALVDLSPTNGSFKPLGRPSVAISRRETEDAAARAFARLPAKRRAELMAAGVATPERRRKP